MEEKITAWVARDEDNSIHMFNDKPAKSVFMWVPCVFGFHVAHDYKLKLKSLLFPQVKWEDEDPTKVELTIKICE